MVHNCLNIIQDKLFPPSCILCGDKGFNNMDLCGECFHDLPVNQNCCYRCAQPFESNMDSSQLCGQCLSNPTAFDETIAPFLYQAGISYLITSLKFGKHYKNARLLGLLMVKHIKTNSELPDCLLPVPLHKSRYRQRGFNQSIEIGKTLSRELQIPLDLNSCRRTRNTGHQTRLPAKQRRKNMKRAFTVIKPIEYPHVAILDDVMTTGSTVIELARTLKRAGVKRVDVWVCARA